MSAGPSDEALRIPLAEITLDADVVRPMPARGVVLFAHGSGSGRHSPRNAYVAGVLNRAGLTTVLVDLLSPEEEQLDLASAELRFDIDLLADRVIRLVDWLQHESGSPAPVGLFGASTGAGAALVAAAARPGAVGAVVSRGGRPDLAAAHLVGVAAPTLLIVGGDDTRVVELNRGRSSSCGSTSASRSSREPPICSRSRGRWSGWASWPGTGSSSISTPRRRPPAPPSQSRTTAAGPPPPADLSTSPGGDDAQAGRSLV